MMYAEKNDTPQKVLHAMQANRQRVKSLAIFNMENPQRAHPSTDAMLRHLQIGHYTFYVAAGVGEASEKKVIVYNISLEAALKLCETYSQESVIFIDMSSDDGYVSEQHWAWEASRLALELRHEEQKNVDAANDADYYTQISTQFNLEATIMEQVAGIYKLLSEKTDRIDVARLINESLDDRRTGYSKYMIRGKLYGRDFYC